MYTIQDTVPNLKLIEVMILDDTIMNSRLKNIIKNSICCIHGHL